MSHGASPVTIHDVPAIVGAEPYKLPPIWRAMSVILIVFGLINFFGHLGTPEDAKQAWTAVHVNFSFWFSMAAASTCFSAVFQICNAQWARPIRRLFEASSTFFLFSPLFLIAFFVFRSYDYLFVWAHEPIPGKEAWLSPQFLYLRDLIGMLLLIFLGRRVVYFSVRQDIGAIRGGLTQIDKSKLARWSDKAYDSYVTGWGPDSIAELKKTKDSIGRLSPVVVIVYALVMSLIAFDQIMSVDPHWYSTMFGGFVFMTAVYLAVAWVSMLVGFSRGVHPLFCSKVERRTLHDLGKLLFGFGIMWTYLFWSQYLPMWYSNMPEETGYLILRLREQPWHDFAWVVLAMCFILPFLLGLSRDVKQTPPLLFCTGMIVACGLWMLHYILFVPSLYPKVIPFGITEIAVSLGFLGVYVLCCASFLSKVPLMPFGDLYAAE
ncbi:MAG: hypothetical protein U0136_11640 [Bdellovibrionota bacterium]